MSLCNSDPVLNINSKLTLNPTDEIILCFNHDIVWQPT